MGSFCICFMVPRYSDTIIEVLCLNSNILSQTYEDFGCSKYHSVTTVLPDLGLPSFDTVVLGILFLLCGLTIIMLWLSC